MSAYVLDASVAAKWFLPPVGETLVEEATFLFAEFCRGRVRLSVPDLFWPETANIFCKAARLERISRESAEEAVRALLELRIPTSASQPLIGDALAIAADFARPVYDCVYVALAVASGRPFLTADERLANALAAYLPVRWLGAAG